MATIAKQTENVTEFGKETKFNGVLNFTDNLIISGKFNGTIKATGNLEINKTAVCTVDKIVAKSVVVSGSVVGDIEGTECVELCKGCSVCGNIKTSNLRIADNVEFEGEVSMLKEAPDVNLFSVASQEFKKSLIIKNSN